MPKAATGPKWPEQVESVEELYLIGLHLEQYRHATYHPLDYYFEALKREPGDVRCNHAVGLLLTRRGKFVEAEPYFRAARSEERRGGKACVRTCKSRWSADP